MDYLLLLDRDYTPLDPFKRMFGRDNVIRYSKIAQRIQRNRTLNLVLPSQLFFVQKMTTPALELYVHEMETKQEEHPYSEQQLVDHSKCSYLMYTHNTQRSRKRREDPSNH